MNLDEDLQRIFTVGAKVYHTQTKKQGRVIAKTESEVTVDFGKGSVSMYGFEEFANLLENDVIVANSRLTMDSRDNFQIKPRVKSPTISPQQAAEPVKMAQGVTTMRAKPSEPQALAFTRDGEPVYVDEFGNVEVQPQSSQSLEIGYINFSTGGFSSEPKKGYTKVEYKKVMEKVTVEVDSEMMEKLKELGLLK